ncbi:hypothetical protein [Pseudalkalibacillus sp. SCS-8]|uniref:hypothetical protein n=1 Tax=Pseudalkalibacillus nanhaiensis TaxID=3115291 RepID=UPI0032DB4A9F
MKKTILLFISTILLVLGGCGGNEFDHDEEKVKDAVANRALQQKVIEEGNYKKEEIEVLKVCEATEKGNEEKGFDGNYIVHWQTADGEYQRKFMMKEYEINYGTNNYEEIKDSCTTFNRR